MKLFKSVPGPEEIQGVQTSTATNSLPTQIGYGTPRLAGNAIWLNGFAASPAPTTNGKGGNKDFGAYVYNAYFLMGLCEGPTGIPINNGTFWGKPTSNEVIYSYVFAGGPNVLTGGQFAGWFFAINGATNAATLEIFKNATVVGLINVPGGSPLGISVGVVELFADTTFNGGDSISITAPASVDATMANLFFSFIMANPPAIKYVDGTAYGFDFTYYTKTQTISELDFIDGNYASSPDSVIVDNWPAQAIAYRGVTQVFGPNYRIDASATLPQLQFVLPTKFVSTSPLNKSTIPLFVQTPPYSTIEVDVGYADADPAIVVADFLTHPIYGVGFPAGFIDPSLFSTEAASTTGDASFQTYCQAVGLAFSVVLDSAESASSILQRWCDLCNTAPVWTGTALKLIPYGDTIYSANPDYGSDNPLGIPIKNFVPNVTPLFSLDDDDFEQSRTPTEDPFTIQRKDVADRYNTVRLSFKDRTNAWNDNVAEAKDENSIELYGIRVDNLETAHEFSIMQYAAQSAQLRVQRNISIDRTFTCKLSWAYCILEPMDVVLLTEPNIGLTNQLARVISIEEDERMVLTVGFEILPLGSSTAVVYPRQASTPSTSFYTGAAPSDVHVPFIFEPTSQLIAAESLTGPLIAVGACGGLLDTADPNWGGCQIWLSIDNVTYALFGQITGPSRMGLLTGNLTGGSSVVPIDLNESGASLETVTTAQANAGLSICALTNSAYTKLEFFTYTTATLTAPGEYNLTVNARGLYGTSANTWSSGDLFLRVDPATFQEPMPSQYVGQTIYAKFVSFNTTGIITETLASAPMYTYVPNGQGIQFNFTTNGQVSGKPTSSEVIINYIFTQTVNFQANFPGSIAYASTGATATAALDVYKNGTLIGTTTFASGGGGGPEQGTWAIASAETFNSGDRLTVTAPAGVDATLAFVSITILGQLA